MRLRFTAAFSATLREKPQPRHFAIITDKMRLGLWKRNTATLKKQIGLRKNDSLRDNMSGLALSYEQLAENLSAVEMEMHNGMYFEESKDIVRRNSM